MSSFNRMLALSPREPTRDFATMLESGRKNIGDGAMYPESGQPPPKKTKLNVETPEPKTSDKMDDDIRSSRKRKAPVSPAAKVCFKKLEPDSIA